MSSASSTLQSVERGPFYPNEGGACRFKRISGLLGRLRPIDQIHRIAALLKESAGKPDCGTARCSLEATAAAAVRDRRQIVRSGPASGASVAIVSMTLASRTSREPGSGMIRADRKVIAWAIVFRGKLLSDI